MGGPLLPRSAIHRPTSDILQHGKEQGKQREEGVVSPRLKRTKK